MDLENKLKGIPHIYYFNLDKKTDRKYYMESQFKKWGLSFTRLKSDAIYSMDTYPKCISDKIVGNTEDTDLRILGPAMMHFDLFRDWIEKTKDEYLIVMEDDYDLNLIEYWHFDWEYLMSRLPYDWDCIQLGYESSDVISFYLHPVKQDYSFGPCLMNRNYIEKLLNLHCVGDKYRFDYNIANVLWKNRKGYKNTSGSIDYFMCQSGKTYSVPLIALNPYFDNWYHQGEWIPKSYFQMCYDSYYDWWKYDRDRFTLDDFFTYGKSYDVLMERRIEYCDAKYFADKSKKCRKSFLKEYGFK